MLLATDAKLWRLKQDIPKRIKHWPFYYDSDLKNDQYVLVPSVAFLN